MITDEWSVNLLGVETPGFTLRSGFARVGLGARPLTIGERVVCASVSVRKRVRVERERVRD